MTKSAADVLIDVLHDWGVVRAQFGVALLDLG
jgi:hypothetical protein